MPWEIKTEIEIYGTTKQVWQEITKFRDFPEWNPFMRQIRGEFHLGAELMVYLRPPYGKAMTFNSTIVDVRHERYFVWLVQMLFPGLFDGIYRFEIVSLGENKVKLIHYEHFSGLLSAIVFKLMEKPTKIGLMDMNHALKTRIESKFTSENHPLG